MRVLLTGAAGFIGSNLFQRCIDEDWHVTGVDDFSNGHMEFVPPHGVYMRDDFADEHVLRKIRAQQFDVVFHLAAIPRVSYSCEHPLETNETNVSKTLKLMDACRGNVKRLVFASSSSVYGGADVLPTPESAQKDPKSPYALQKSIIEDYLKMFYELYGLDSACMRFFNVIGKNALGSSPYSTALAAWLSAIHADLSMRSDGDGTQSRDLCPVDNVAEALVLAAKHSEPLKADKFNVACGTRTTNKEILDYLLERYQAQNARFVTAPWRAGDVMHTQADITKIGNTIGYKPIQSAWECIDKACAWWDENWDWLKNLKQGV